MKCSEGLVSVVTPAFNAADVIAEAVESVLLQGGVVLEHIIIDDGSTDNTAAVLKEIAREWPHVKIIEQSNLGAAAARNKGIKEASGRYIAFLDADDVWLAGKLEAQVAYMMEEKVLFSYGDYTEVDGVTGDGIVCYHLPEVLKYKDLLRGCPIGCLTAAYDQSALGKIYMPNVRRGQDWGLWLAITRGGVPAQKYPGNYARYRIGVGSLSGSKMKKIIDVFKIYNREESFGYFKSAFLVGLHAGYVFRKLRLRKQKISVVCE